MTEYSIVNYSEEKVKSAIQSGFSNLQFNVALIGSGFGKDVDLVIIPKESSSTILEDVDLLIKCLKAVMDEIEVAFFIKHSERFLIHESITSIHLLYYPNFRSFYNNEMLSLVASTYKDGRFIYGDNEKLKNGYDLYRKNELFHTKTSVKQIDFFVKSSIDSILYLEFTPFFFPLSAFAENLIYTLRFLLSELFFRGQYSNEMAESWNWQNFLSLLARSYPHQSILIELFNNRNKFYKDASCRQIVNGFRNCIEIAEKRKHLENEVIKFLN